MPRDLLDECLNIELSRSQRAAWDRLLLLTAGIAPDEADRIVTMVEADRAAVAAVEMEVAA